MPINREPDKTPLGFKIWFVFCALIATASLAGAGLLLFALIDWLGRH